MAYSSKNPKFATETFTDQGGDPTTPAAGTQIVYSKTAGIFSKNSSGTVTQFGSVTVATSTTTGTVTSFVPAVINAVKSVSSANYTILDNDGYDLIEVSTGSTTRSITLPTAANNAGRTIQIIKTDSGTGFVTVTGTLNGVSNYTLISQYSAITIRCDGANYYIIDTSGDASAQGTMTGFSWAGGTPPGAGTIVAGYIWRRTGKTVNFWARYTNTIAGTGNTSFTFDFPTELPTPFTLSGWAASEEGYVGTGLVGANAGSTSTSPNYFSLVKDGGGSPRFFMRMASTNVAFFNASIAYPTT